MIFGVKLYKGDVTDKESMREAMTGADVLFAWRVGISMLNEPKCSINVVGTKKCSCAVSLKIERCTQARVRSTRTQKGKS